MKLSVLSGPNRTYESRGKFNTANNIILPMWAPRRHASRKLHMDDVTLCLVDSPNNT